jgi:8-oxo-dGTP pyrophosphatase MutT (NUDIX family)
VLVRGEGEALETYWALRGDAVGYMPGFRAFVGGKVDADDGELAIAGAGDDAERTLMACAIREAFEETGVWKRSRKQCVIGKNCTNIRSLSD